MSSLGTFIFSFSLVYLHDVRFGESRSVDLSKFGVFHLRFKEKELGKGDATMYKGASITQSRKRLKLWGDEFQTVVKLTALVSNEESVGGGRTEAKHVKKNSPWTGWNQQGNLGLQLWGFEKWKREKNLEGTMTNTSLTESPRLNSGHRRVKSVCLREPFQRARIW